MAGFYMIEDIELKNVENKVESFNKIVKLNEFRILVQKRMSIR